MLTSILLSIGCCFSTAHAAVSNPFLLAGTDVPSGVTEFDVIIQLNKAVNLSAFDISLDYDETVLEVADKQGVGYDFTEEFQRFYSGGYTACNDRKNTEVMFAGAKTGAGNYAGTVAKIHFRVKAANKAATTLYLNVRSVAGDSQGSIVKLDITNPKVDYLVKFGSFQGAYGDVNLNGKVEMDDAQAVLKAALKISSLAGEGAVAADVNQDGEITLADAQLVLKKALRIIP